MKKEKGFTLIELLAVIVILAIIALIAIPVIMNILDEANKSAFKDTAYAIVDAGELYFSEQQLELDGMNKEKTFEFPKDANVEGGIQIKGEVPSGTTLRINENGEIALAMSNGKYCATKRYTDKDVIVTEDYTNCDIYHVLGEFVVGGDSTLTLQNSLGEVLKDYKIYGNSIQNGTPTSATPVKIESVGEYDETTGKYKIPVKIRGKNLFNINNYRTTSGGVTIEDNTITLVSSTEKRAYIVYRIPVSEYAGKRIVFSSDYTTDLEKLPYHNIRLRRADDTNIETYSGQPANEKSYDLPLEVDYVALELYASNALADGTSIFSNVMVEVGDTATEYEPYVEPIIINIYLDEPLRKVGDYVDYIDFINKKVYRNVMVVDDTGTLPIEESYRGVVDEVGTDIELPQIPTFKGTTVIEVNTEIKPSNTTVIYRGES